MYKKKENILIVGCGNMGKAHINSFINKKKINLFIYDKNKSQIKEYENNKNITILNNLKLLKKYKFCTVSTNSFERFNVFKNLVDQKKIEIFLLEKFMFLKKSNYSYVKKNYDCSKIFNNVWGKFMYKKVLKYNIGAYRNAIVSINEGHLLTNFVHFMNFFSCYQNFIKVVNYNLYPIKIKSHDEFKGNLMIQFTRQSVFFCTKKIKNNFEILFYNKDNKNNFKIVVKNDLIFYFYINSRLVHTVKFPLASFFSYKIFQKNLLVPNFIEILDDNLNILKIFKQSNINKKLLLIR